MVDETREEWKQYLTPELRAHFERVGEELVQFDVSHHNYKEREKHLAAIYWLGEKRQARERRKLAIFWLMVAFVVLANLGIGISIWLSGRFSAG